jgi:hypothetical protein
MGLLSTIGAASARAYGFTRSAIAAAVDAYFNRVTLLLPGNGTNGAQNNTFLDSSSNNFSITRNGNTTQGTFSPFSQTGWSNYFGTGYLTVPTNAAFDFGSGDATIEAWIYPTSSSQTCGIFDKRSSGANYSQFPQLALSSGAIVVLVSYNGSSWAVTINGATPAVNAWSHIAVVRNGNTWTLYVNGTVSGTPVTASGSVYASTDSLCIGVSTTSGTNPFTGYISNARIVKGTAVYTSAFTPSTTPLTAITNTSLLTCQSNRFVDTSSNAFAITPNGTYSVQAFSPFAPTAAYSAATNGGSGYFDGSGDYLTKSNINFSTNAFTIEGWFYVTSSAANVNYWGQDNGGGTNPKMLLYGDNSGNFVFETGSVSGAVISVSRTTYIKVNAWQHIVIARGGTGTNQTAMFIDGVRVGTGTCASLSAITAAFNLGYIGEAFGVTFNGYVSGFRIVNGTDVYGYSNTTITVPTAPPTNITNTNTLLNFTNGGVIDATGKNVLETVGNAQISTTQSKWGGSSMGFTTSGARLQGNSLLGNSVAFGTGDFTIEVWVYLTSTSADSTIMDTRPGANSGNYFLFYLWTNGGGQQPTISWYVPGGSVLSTGTISANTWTHVAICRSGGTIRSFKDGVQQASASNTTAYANPGAPYPYIGADYPGGVFQGYMDDLRITKYARYTGNFTPPAAALPLQ